MAKGLSLHIGLNSIDPMHYNTNGILKGCESDARCMQRIALQMGFNPTLLLTSDATSHRIISELNSAAQSLTSGDLLLVTYSGHGAQIPDSNNDEEDGLDETWCVFDRMIIDDELERAWQQFKGGVRIVVVSDSCHSGTVTKLLNVGPTPVPLYSDDLLYRCLPPEIIDPVYHRFENFYTNIKLSMPRNIGKTDASVMLFSGCMDNQLCADGLNNGYFTGKLLEAWGGAGYKGSYRSLYNRLTSMMPAVQTPNFYLTGTANPEFESQQAFAIEKERGLENSAGPVDTIDGIWRSVEWTLQVDEGLCSRLTDDELESYLRNLVKSGLMTSYKKVQDLKRQSVFQRGGDGSVSCGVSDHGWHCEAGAHFGF